MKPGLKAGIGTVKDFLAEEGTRTDSTLVEDKQTIREQTGKSTFTQTMTANDGSQSKLGEKDVYLAEKRAAQDAIQRQDIPAGYREYLRKYFDAIEPDEVATEDR